MMVRLNHFDTLPASPPWNTHLRGGGSLTATGSVLRFANPPTQSNRYTNAQIDDYQGLPRRRFLWQPPLRFTVRARFSHSVDQLSGTAGFGFWNDPFMMTGLRTPTLPRAAWFFFASPPSNMKLARDVPGFGWKAATIDALHPAFFGLLPFAPLAVPLMNIPSVYRACWPVAQRAIHVSEAPVRAEMTERHIYTIDWQPESAQFSVDGQMILDCETPPRGPLGFVMWLDNQYMVVTPWGRFKYGLLSSPGEQWMEIDRLEIEH